MKRPDMSTFEVDAWSRNFNYEQYIDYAQRANKQPVSREEYKRICTEQNEYFMWKMDN